MVRLFNVKDEEDYYKRLLYSITTFDIFGLQRKAEYGSSRSERGYLQTAAFLARKIAEKLDLNSDTAQILTMCKGAFFPTYGREGIKAVLEYIKTHGLEISELDLARTYIEYTIYEWGSIVTPGLDVLLKELFENDISSNIPEVKIAIICNKAINIIKILDKIPSNTLESSCAQVEKMILDACIAAGKPVYCEDVDRLISGVPYESKKITDAEIKKIFTTIDTFVDYEKDCLTGILTYMQAGLNIKT